MNAAKQFLLNCLLIPGFPASFRYIQRQCSTIFMLHRFHEPERGITGCSAAHLRQALTYLAKNGYELVGLTELFERLAGRGPEPRGAVAFTIDDGYIDQAIVAAPVFAEFDCPVTTFVSTGFLDGRLWLWWDQIEYIFENTARTWVQVELADARLSYRWENEDDRKQAQSAFTERCKRVTQAEKLAAISRLAHAAEVALPSTPPSHCAPMSWDQLRACERMGMTFGPHTVTHPVLARATADQARSEIVDSWNRLRAEAQSPVRVFCYPNGGWDDFGDREVKVLRELGFVGAVVAEPGYASGDDFRRASDGPYRVQRFGMPDDMPHLVQYVSGVERLKQLALQRAG